MKEEEREIFFPFKYRARGFEFVEAYRDQKFIVCPEKKMKGLKPKPKRVCRFCKLKYGEVFFKSDAHIFPQLLGNKFLISDFECSNCNTIFSSYESHLSNFIGPAQAFQKINGAKQDYKFKSPDKKTFVENFGSYGLSNSLSVSRENVKDQTFEFDRLRGETTINLPKQSYSPIYVYKSILKIALSCINDDEVKNYDLAFKCILSDKLDALLSGIAKMLVYSVPPGKGYTEPFACLYKKRNPEQDIYTHVFVVHFMNYTYQICLPLNVNDFKMYRKEPLGILLSSPVFGDIVSANTLTIKEQLIQMDSKELVKGEVESFKLNYNPHQNAAVYDPKTNTIKKDGFNSEAVTKIVFMPEDAELKFPI